MVFIAGMTLQSTFYCNSIGFCLGCLNKDPRYKRHSSSPSLSRNLCFGVLIKDGGLSEEDGENNLRRNPFPRVRKKSMQKRKGMSLIRTFCLTVKIQPESSISTLKVRRMKIILFRPTKRCETQKSTVAQCGGRNSVLWL